METKCDVTLNCVIRPDVSFETCFKFIEYAKSVGADAVSFRKEASDVSPTEAEKLFETIFGVVGRSNCPVCRGMEQRVNGFPVRWKGSVPEPSITTNGVYEVVIHPDGNTYADWSMTKRVILGSNNPSKRVKRLETTRQDVVRSSCGTSSCGSSSHGCGYSGCGSSTSSCGSSSRC